MPTGAKFSAFNLKQLIGWQDLGARGFAALRASHIESTLARWDVDGTFSVKLGIAANGAGAIQITGTSKCTDGIGHILNVAAAYKKDAPFQNTNAIVYHVGLMYAEIPAGLRINPKTGKPQFDQYVEEVGFAAVPTSVTDNGNGTITFNVNSVTEASVTNAGRVVRVYKVIPGDGCTTFSQALEECTVSFSSPNNTITTVGKFGQTTVSTVAGDYIVVCMGPRIARNTDLSAVSGVAYIGTVTGNAGTPSTFSTTNQRLLQTFQDASQISYTPAGWLAPGATNVQTALDALVNGLQASTPSGAAAGSARIGLYPPDWTAVSSGGVGTVADGTFTTSATLTNFALAVDTAIRRRQALRTKNDGVGVGADESTGTSLANQMGNGTLGDRAWMLKTLANAGTTPYSLAGTTASPNMGSYVMGEFSDPSQASPHLRKTRVATSGNIHMSGGKWQRIWIDPPAGASPRFGGSGGKSGLIMEDFGLNGGNIAMDTQATATAEDPGFNFRNGVIKPKDEATKGFSGSWVNGFSGGTTSFLWSVFENLLVHGPSATQTSPAAPCSAILIGSQVSGAINATTVAAQPRPFVYRDCVIVMQRTSDFAALTVSSQHKVIFENCHFFGLAGAATGALIVGAANNHLVMRDCVVFAPEASGIDLNPSSGCHATLENVTIVAGVGGSSTITAPCALQLRGDRFGVNVDNCRVILGSAAFRTSGTPGPLVQIGNASGSGRVNVRNLHVRVDGGTDLGWAKLVSVQTSLVGAPPVNNGTYVDGLFVDCGALPPNSSSTNSLLAFEGSAPDKRVNVEHLQIVNVGRVVTTAFDRSLVECGSYVTGRCWDIRTPSQGAGTATIRDHLRVASFCHIDDVMLAREGNERYAIALVVVLGSSNILRNVRSDVAQTPASTPSKANFMHVEGHFNVITEFNCPVSTTGGVAGINVEGHDNEICDAILTCTTNTAGWPIDFAANAERRNRAVDLGIHYNGTTSGAVRIQGPESLTDSCVFYRSAGAVAAVSNGGAGAVNGDNLTSTTL